MHAESDNAGYYSSVSYHTATASPPRAGGGGKGAAKGAAAPGEEQEDDFGVAKDKAKAGMGKLSGMFSSSEPHLHVMLVHKEGAAKTSPAKAGGGGGGGAAGSPARAAAGQQNDPSDVVKPGKGGGGGAVGVPEGDKLLGEAFVNIVDLATARAKSLDEWFPLSEVGGAVNRLARWLWNHVTNVPVAPRSSPSPQKHNQGGAVRLVVEYDVIEPPPQPGEVVRLLGFGSASDLWPLPLRQEMVVERYVVRRC